MNASLPRTPGCPRLSDAPGFPDPRRACRGGPFDGLVALGGDLSVPRLLAAYRAGIFPWTVDPITWWSPDPRGILELDRLHVSRTMRRVLRQAPFTVTRDHAFRQVMEGCAARAPGRRETWVTPEFIAAYSRLHDAGYAHSLECWQSGVLAGGIYGVALGSLFAGESMFHRVGNASKAALVHLVEHLQARGFTLFDIQMITPVTEQFGAVDIAREAYLQRLAAAVDRPASF